MASTLTKILLHIVFSTKDRAAFIAEELEPELYAYIGGICRRMGSPLLAMGGVTHEQPVRLRRKRRRRGMGGPLPGVSQSLHRPATDDHAFGVQNRRTPWLLSPNCP